ncbi:MAG: DNA alkylation repair protein [Phycisphaerae bacterium]|nr:DNA alkylation repair protein [Phycisphaerae bacterium]
MATRKPSTARKTRAKQSTPQRSGASRGRVAARRPSDVDAAILAELNAGTRETRNLAEGLAIDFAALLRTILPRLADAEAAAVAPTVPVTRRMPAAAAILARRLGTRDALNVCLKHRSDTLRGVAAYIVAIDPAPDIAERLRRIRPLADDRHFGVREWAWLPMRPFIAERLSGAIESLRGWTADPSPAVRRYASEATRPRGVWCAHIGALKADPSLGLPILEPLRADSEKYVQDSVANWLNDAAKSQPRWVRELCRRWLRESPCEATARICKRAQRSLV